MKKVYIRKVAVSIGIVALLILFVSRYVAYVQGQLWEQSINFVLDTTEQGKRAFVNRIGRDQEKLSVLADMVKLYGSENLSLAQKKLNERSEDENTVYYCFDEKSVSKQNVEEAVWKYIENNPQLDRGIVAPYMSSATGERVFDIFIKADYDDGGSFYIDREYKVSEVASEFTMSFYNNQGFSYIISDSGDILIRPAHANSNKTVQNIFDIIKSENNDEKDINAFAQAITQDKKGWAVLNYNDMKTFFCFAGVETSNDWNIVTIIPVNVIQAQGQSIIHRTMLLLAAAIVGICIVVTMFAYTASRSRKIIREREYRDFLFDLLSTSIDDVFLIYDPDNHRSDYIFENVERQFGIKRTQVKKDISSLIKLFDSADNRQIMEGFLSGSLNKNILDAQCPYHRPDTGEHKIAKMDIYATNDPRFGKKYIMCLRDETAEAEMRQIMNESLVMAEEANKAKSEFLNSMSHDIRTPMNAIVGMTAIAKSNMGNEEKVKDCLDKITTASDHLCSLINEVLDMSRIDSGKIELNEEDIHLSETVHGLLSIVQNEALCAGLKLTVRNKNVIHDNLSGDGLRLNQVCLNIIGNAVKFTNPGGEITIVTEEFPAKAEDKVNIRFTISDTGIGISEELMGRVFEPFERGETENVSRIQGTGLGLAITKRLVNAMGGDINVKSKLGKGSIFEVEIPFKVQSAGEPEAFCQLNGLSALIISDNVFLFKNVRVFVEDYDINTVLLSSAQETEEFLKTADKKLSSYDVVILDGDMLKAKLIFEECKSRGNKVILISDEPLKVLEKWHITAADETIQKPVFRTDLLNALLSHEQPVEAQNLKDAYKADYSVKRMLLVEDNELNMEIATEIISSTGIKIERAWNGKQALEMVKASAEGYYDIICTDIRMPVMDGYEETKEIRALERKDVKSIPIVAMTANAFSEDRKEAECAGMSDYLAKPLDIRALFSVLSKWLL